MTASRAFAAEESPEDPLATIDDRLTDDERAAMALVAAGARDDDAAAHLYISRSTLQRRLRSAMSKLGARTRAEACYLLGHLEASGDRARSVPTRPSEAHASDRL